MKVAAKMRKQLNYTGKMQLFLFLYIKKEGDLIRKQCSNEMEMKMFYMRLNPLTTLKMALQNVRCKFYKLIQRFQVTEEEEHGLIMIILVRCHPKKI